MSVVWTYTRLPWDCQADQWKQLWGTWKVNGEWWALKEWDIPEELGEEQHTLAGAENYHISCSAGLSQAVLGIDMCIPWNRCDKNKPGLRSINSLSSPLLQGASFCCWLWLPSQFHADDQQLAWEHNSDFEQRNCHVDRYCPCMQRPSPRGSTARIASGLSIMELNRIYCCCQ